MSVEEISGPPPSGALERYLIGRVVEKVERFTVLAHSPEEAMELFKAGKVQAAGEDGPVIRGGVVTRVPLGVKYDEVRFTAAPTNPKPGNIIVPNIQVPPALDK